MNKIWGMLELSLKRRKKSKEKSRENTGKSRLSSHCHLRSHGWDPMKEQPLVRQELKLEEEEEKNQNHKVTHET